MDWKHLLASITGTVDQELLVRNEYLVTENRVVSLNCRDETYPNAGTGTRWHAMDPGMLPRRARTTMHWSPRHDRRCHRRRRSHRAPCAQRTGIACGLWSR